MSACPSAVFAASRVTPSRSQRPSGSAWATETIARPEAIVFARVRRIDHAYVIFDHDHYPALEAVQEFLTSHRILSAGRYGGWNYSSMGDALAFGRQAAERAAGMLG